ncbi:autoinducer binding domain-containing protein [Bradyrhizobium yuanmingense]|uniref:autoinducer binding domain-containing protein n=1 Tax=Bradyrhizobium yuanmingense TaxID=108015 RepID=UPI0023BA354E|nr:autoinducer binding domain-containing protein [Bradyrhizobium yuanmingense]MDF0522995.1 autoinducer binding domain-containing protein [Bradyrhizobium yuanmingense]
MATNNIATHPRDDAGAIFRNAVWEQLAKEYQLQACEQRILEEARQAGLKHGISVPLFGLAGRLSMVHSRPVLMMPILKVAWCGSKRWLGTSILHLRRLPSPQTVPAIAR